MKKHFAFCVLALASAASTARAVLLVNGGFETGSATIGPPPSAFGQWQGDGSVYATSTLGITLYEGTRMLQFVSAKHPAESTVLVDSQHYQNIDLSAYAAPIALGQAVISVSAMFNRVSGDAQTDTQFGLRIRARSGTGSLFTELGNSFNLLFSDSNPATWEPLAITGYTLPAGTTYAQLEVFATENVFNDTGGVEFDGHFADAVSVNVDVVPEPGGLLLATVCGFAGLCRLRHKRSTP